MDVMNTTVNNPVQSRSHPVFAGPQQKVSSDSSPSFERIYDGLTSQLPGPHFRSTLHGTKGTR